MHTSLAVDSCSIKVEPVGCYKDEESNRALTEYVRELKCIFTVESSFAGSEIAFSGLHGKSFSIYHFLDTMLSIHCKALPYIVIVNFQRTFLYEKSKKI